MPGPGSFWEWLFRTPLDPPFEPPADMPYNDTRTGGLVPLHRRSPLDPYSDTVYDPQPRQMYTEWLAEAETQPVLFQMPTPPFSPSGISPAWYSSRFAGDRFAELKGAPPPQNFADWGDFWSSIEQARWETLGPNGRSPEEFKWHGAPQVFDSGIASDYEKPPDVWWEPGREPL